MELERLFLPLHTTVFHLFWPHTLLPNSQAWHPQSKIHIPSQSHQFSSLRSSVKNQITTQIYRIQYHKHKFGPTKIHTHKSTLSNQCIQDHDQNKTQIGPSYHRHHYLWPATIVHYPLSLSICVDRCMERPKTPNREWEGRTDTENPCNAFWVFGLGKGHLGLLTWWHLSNSHVGVMWLSIPSIVTLNLMLGWEV